MNVYDIALTVALTILAMTLFFVVDYFKDKTKELEDTVTNLDAYINVIIDPQIKRIREVVNNEIMNKKRDNANTCSKEKCPINAYTFKTCGLSENECEYYTSKDPQEVFQDDWEGIRHWLALCKRDGAKDYYIDQMWDIVWSRTDIIKSDKFSYTPEKIYIRRDPDCVTPGYVPSVKDVCVIVEIDENGRPYYSIRYVSPDNVCHVGYSSYKLKTVLMFLKEYFECEEE